MPKITSTTTSNSISLSVENVKEADSEGLLKVYMMLAPFDAKGTDIKLSVVNNGQTYTSTKQSVVMEAGKYYKFNLEKMETVPSPETSKQLD